MLLGSWALVAQPQPALAPECALSLLGGVHSKSKELHLRAMSEPVPAGDPHLAPHSLALTDNLETSLAPSPSHFPMLKPHHPSLGCCSAHSEQHSCALSLLNGSICDLMLSTPCSSLLLCNAQ
uniref:Uncharacterized protein n=1 Tax=Physcomitrium patens TaxID=3218 RepID=A0A2K1K2F1_PHYPA|nr:hypothetical protein PHYPA_012434 [Physcomitrium patens]